MENAKSALKRLGTFIFVGAVLLTAINYCAGQKKERRWDLEWKKSPDLFQLSATKRKRSRKERY